MSASVVWFDPAVKQEAIPPSSNTGGKSVGAHSVQSATIIDYLSFSFPGCDLPADEWIPVLSAMLRAWTGGNRVRIEPRKSGLYGYKQSWLVQWVTLKEVIQLGVIAYGGNGGSCYVSISGTGCGFVRDWIKVAQTLDKLQAKLTRVDLAVDFMHGEVTFEQACQAYREGSFTNGGRPPSHRVTGDILAEQSTEGRTLYVGNRANGKMMRLYEKGRQLGDPTSLWLRGEVELRAVDQALDLGILTSPDNFFAGAYAFCAEILPQALGVMIERTREKGRIHLSKLMHHAKLAYGRLLSFLRDAGASADDIVATLAEEGAPSRLLETVADVEHRYGHWSVEEWGIALAKECPF